MLGTTRLSVWKPAVESRRLCTVVVFLFLSMHHCVCQFSDDGQDTDKSICESLLKCQAGRCDVTSDDIVEVGRNLQILVDCVPSRGSLILGTEQVALDRSITLTRPIRIQSGLPDSGDGSNQVQFICPDSGTALEIRSSGVVLSDLHFANCNLNDSSIINIFPDSDVTVEDSTFSNNANRNGAGCIWALNASLVIQNCLFWSNTGMAGGALLLKDSNLKIASSVFVSNKAQTLGGAVYMEASDASTEDLGNFKATFDNVAFVSNSVNYSAGAGGAVAFLGGRLSISVNGSEFRANSGYYGGAAILEGGARMKVAESKFVENSALEDVGGAILVWGKGSSLSAIDNTVFEGNTAKAGGAVFLGPETTSVLSDVFFLKNEAKRNGGALAGWNVAEIDIEKVRFKGNRATLANGGAVAIKGDLMSSKIRMEGSKFKNNTAMEGKGGAVYLSCGNVTAEIGNNTRFVRNSADVGGALCAQASQKAAFLLFLDTVEFKNNQANVRASAGGAADFSGEGLSVVVSNAVFTDNTAFEGGAARIGVGANVSVVHSSFVNSTAGMSRGGALLVWSATVPTNLTIMNSSFVGNVADDGSGGALALVDGNITLSIGDNTTFRANRARVGGAVDAFSTSADVYVTVNDTHFQDNTAGRFEGGATAMVGNIHANFSNAKFERNTAETEGGAVHVFDAVHMDIVNCPFLNNRAHKMGGGAAFEHRDVNTRRFQANDNMVIVIKSSTFQGNSAGGSGNPGSTCESSRTSWFPGKGGGMAIIGAGTNITMQHLVFKNGKAQAGGGIYCEHGNILEAQNVTVTGNRAVQGGGMHAEFSDLSVRRFLLSNMVFSGNEAQKGGGLLLSAGVDKSQSLENIDFVGLGRDVSVSSSSFENNTAWEQGGGLAIEGVQLTCEDCSFLLNKVNKGSGGGVSAGVHSYLVLKESVINGNNASRGGGVFVEDGAAVCSSVEFVGNRATDVGGGMSMKYSGSVTYKQDRLMYFEDCNITGNRAKRLGGGVHFIADKLKRDAQGLCVDLETIEAGDCSEGSCESAPHSTPFDNRTVSFTNIVFLDNGAGSAGNVLFTNNLALVERCVQRVCSRPFLPQGNIPWFPQASCGMLKTGEWCSKSAVSSVPARVELGPRAITSYSSGEFLEAVQISVKDALGQVVSGQTMSLAVTSKSPNIMSGNTVATRLLDKGTSTVTDLIFRATPGYYSLTFEVSGMLLGEDSISANLSVVVRECGAGEKSAEDNLSCIKCLDSEFSFNSTGCFQCPDNAVCNGSTLVPQQGFWHATSQSTTITRCVFEPACDYKNRAQLLSQMAHWKHVGSGNRTWKIWEEGDYQLCDEGFEGPLCGSCSEDYGRVGAAKCEGCPYRVLSIGFPLVSFLFLIGVVLFLTIDSLSHGKKIRPKPSVQPPVQTPVRHCRASSSGSTSVRSSWGGSMSDRELESSASSTLQLFEIDAADVPVAPSVIGMVTGDASPFVGWRRKNRRSLVNQPKLRANQSIEVLKILLNFLQVIGTAGAINAHWTGAILKVLGVSDVLGGVSSGNGWFSFDCAFKSYPNFPRSIQSYIVQILAPFGISIILSAFWVAWKWYRKLTGKELKQRVIVTCVIAVYVSYINITKKVVSIFDCVKVEVSTDPGQPDEALLWTQDTSVQCYTGVHKKLVWWMGMPLLVCVVFGLPVGLMVKLWRNREKLNNDAIFAGKYGFLYKAYQDKTVFWETVVLAKKGLLATIVVCSGSLGAALQGTLAVSVLLVALLAHIQALPYDESLSRLNNLETWSLLTSITTFLCGLLFILTGDNAEVRALLSVIVTLAILCFVGFVLRQLRLSVNEWMDEWMRKEKLQKQGNWCRNLQKVALHCWSIKVQGKVDTILTRANTMMHSIKWPASSSISESGESEVDDYKQQQQEGQQSHPV